MILNQCDLNQIHPEKNAYIMVNAYIMLFKFYVSFYNYKYFMLLWSTVRVKGRRVLLDQTYLVHHPVSHSDQTDTFGKLRHMT